MSKDGHGDGGGLPTRLIHHAYRPPEGFESPAEAVHKGSTVFFRDVAHLRSQRWIDKSGYTYGLHGTPTTFTLEERIASLEGARHALLLPSGLAAIAHANLALLSQGERVLLPDNVYGPSKVLARQDLARWGIGHGIYDPMDPASLASQLTQDVRLVWLEAPGSVSFEFPDLRGLVRLLRERAPQALIALDNTWGAGIAFDAFALGEGLGVDLTVHALTKYPSGGGDVLMGSLCTVDDALQQRLAMAHGRLGHNVGVDDAAQVLRSLPSLPLRYAAQDAAARRIAQWCASRPELRRVLHPALPGSPGHEHWAGLCRAAAGLFSVEFDPRHGAAQVDAVVDALRLFRIGWSWGGPVSLAVPYDTRTIRSGPPRHEGLLLRLCIGLESPEDLIADLEQALGVL